MPHVTRKRSVVAALAAGALLLGACGVGGASHVVRPNKGTAASAASGASATSGIAASGITSQQLSQLDNDLGSLENTLNQTNSDLDNQQGDS
ncbi:MAG TPA: hypothetical protein VMU09_07950 [Acidimicrobiales bacterium]|nr:hypothetical protein [Acidimicrobiales bacterium]